MSRPQKAPLRPLTADELVQLTHLSRGQSAPAATVAHAKALVAVAGGYCFAEAARLTGWRSGYGVALLVTRFNRAGLAAVPSRHGGGQPKRYQAREQERILAEVRRTPDREVDGTATWSLTTLRRTLRQAPDGLPQVSTYTIWGVLHQAGISWQRDRSWCETGAVLRQRKRGTVVVHDPDAAAKKA
jgi:transposase